MPSLHGTSIPRHSTSEPYSFRHAGSDRAQEALGYLRSAVRKEPSSAKFLNDLGVAEMRLGQLHSARKRFLKALQADASYKVRAQGCLCGSF